MNLERRVKIKNETKAEFLVSAEKGKGIRKLKKGVYDKLNLMNLFLKEVNKPADMEEPLIIFRKSTIRDVCLKLHRDFVEMA